MSRWVLNVAYLVVAMIATPFLLWRLIRHGKRTPALLTKLTGSVRVPAANGRRVWLHAVSVGEVLQVRPLIRELRAIEPDLDVVLSTTTAAGLKLAEEKYDDCHVVPFPFDFSWAVRRAFRTIAPDAVALVELELWPNFIAEAGRQRVPLVVANGRLSESSHAGYERALPIVGGMFRRLSHVCAQNETYRERFASLGVAAERLSVTGSIKFDGLATDRNREAVVALRDAFGFDASGRVFMAGSTHEPEESIAVDAWLKARESIPDLRLIVVPRHPERFDAVAAMIEERGLTVTRRSSGGVADHTSVRLLDTVGELSACWGLADIAFVGGTLTQRGGQNMLEPAAYGCPVLLGPNVWNFTEIAAGLSDVNGSETVLNADELASAVSRLCDDDGRYEAMSVAARGFAASQSGAAAETARRLLSVIDGGVERGGSVPVSEAA